MRDWRITIQNREVRQFPLEEGQTVVIGRGAEADLTLDNPAVSRTHMSLQLLNGVCFVNDLGSTNGTLLNGERVASPTPVSPGDEIQIGKFRITSLTPKAAEEDKPAPADLDATVFVAPEAKPVKREVTRPPRLTVVHGTAQPAGCSTEGKAELSIGKGSGSDLRVGGWLLGSPQCRVVLRGDRYALIPDGRWRATTLNGIKLRGETPLSRGDEIGVGGTRFRFE